MADGLQLLKTGFKLNIAQEGLVVRVGWVALVTFHILWVCGWLAPLGFVAPFAYANDVNSLREATYVSARINIADEIRKQVAICRAQSDPNVRLAIASQIERLQEEYKKFSGGQKYDAQTCS